MTGKPDKKYKGVIVPMVTPLTAEGKIDNDAVAAIMQKLYEAGAHPFVLGTTGESVSVPVTEKLQLVGAIMDNKMSGMIVFAGISGNSLQESVEQARLFAERGVDAVVAHLPFYFPLSPEQMLKYFLHLAARVPLPLIIYNNPITVKQSIPIDVAEQLSYHSNIAGMKDSERGLERLDRSLKLWKSRPDFSFLVGWSAQSAYSILNGADGIVPGTGNFMPRLYKNIYDAAMHGDSTNAFEYQEKADRISDIYLKDKNISQSIPALKYLMSLSGLCQPYVLSPLVEADDRAKSIIREEAEKVLISENIEWK
ncbi:MAG: dihydrodipicolinate synthase family protein [Bacteroidales bacterium]|nr:dihydrodipicolinate synthase family protein [Bacteroidales bacterium]